MKSLDVSAANPVNALVALLPVELLDDLALDEVVELGDMVLMKAFLNHNVQ